MNKLHLFASIIGFTFYGAVIADPLPLTPSSQHTSHSIEKDGTTLSFTFWKESLAIGDTTLMKISSIKNEEVFICGSSFEIVQNGQKFNSFKLHSGESSKQCHVFKNEKTFYLEQTSIKFDDKTVYSIIFDKKHRFDIPATLAIRAGTHIDENLNIHLSSATLQTPNGAVNIWANLEPNGVNEKGDFIWRLKGYGVNK